LSPELSKQFPKPLPHFEELLLRSWIPGEVPELSGIRFKIVQLIETV
jgi:hypothetical protein